MKPAIEIAREIAAVKAIEAAKPNVLLNSELQPQAESSHIAVYPGKGTQRSQSMD